MKKTAAGKVFNFKLWFLIFSFQLFVTSSAFADTSSTNYSLSSDHFASGGALSITSSSYKVEEGTLDSFAKDNLTSTNYKVDGKMGVAGQHNVALVSSVTPGNFAKYYTDESTSFTVTAQDPDSDTLQYQAKQDGTTKDGPQASNNLVWALSTSDRGRRALSLEVIDPDGTVSKPQAMYVYRRPVK